MSIVIMKLTNSCVPILMMMLMMIISARKIITLESRVPVLVFENVNYDDYHDDDDVEFDQGNNDAGLPCSADQLYIWR